MQPEGAGALAAEFERLRARLEADGLLAAERKRPLPAFPQRVGLVTSPTGAVLHDVTDVLARYEQTVLLHRWLTRNQALGRPEPESLEDATFLMSRDPASRPPKDSRANRPMRNMQRRMQRRGF